MPKVNTQVTLVTRLAEPDLIRFRELALTQKVTYSELLREAVLFYMDNYEQAKSNKIEGQYAQQLKASTNRICGLMAKTGIEVHAIIEFLRRMEGGPELVQECISIAAKRMD
ncbi:MAG: hypothetical protein K2X81_17465, partial [Candidatus Obscuribacterales bacterium]|nr:hypothetical protein [Candidatus Obscuribacterales bacterium]